jgi:flagellar biosynthetic protein FliR
MIVDPQGTILALFLTFCRIGGCFMTLPGFSSGRIPMQVRLFLCAGLSMALMPILWESVYPQISKSNPAIMVGLIMSETLIGVTYGLIARFFTLGMQFTGTLIGNSIGFSAPGGADPIEDTQDNQISTLLMLSAMLLLFLLDFHHFVIKTLVDSYSATPVGALISSQKILITLTDTLRASTRLSLRLATPFILYSLMFNISIGLINKLAQQIPVYFISTPYLLAGGLFMFYLSIAALVRQFADAFGPIFLSF